MYITHLCVFYFIIVIVIWLTFLKSCCRLFDDEKSHKTLMSIGKNHFYTFQLYKNPQVDLADFLRAVKPIYFLHFWHFRHFFGPKIYFPDLVSFWISDFEEGGAAELGGGADEQVLASCSAN